MQRLLRQPLSPVFLLAAWLFTGCGGELDVSSETGSSSLNIGVDDRPYLRVSPTNLELLARPERWLEVVHVGRRRVTFYDESGGSSSFIERVATDGSGRFSIEPVEALTPLELDWGSFHLRQVSRQGFIFRHRDFAIRDVQLFQENWTLEELGYNSTVAGRRCDLLRARRVDAPNAPSYQLLIDSAGLLLAYREFDSDEQLMSEMRYLSFTDDPSQEVLDEIIWYEPALDENLELDWNAPLGAQVPRLNGKSLFVPRWLPSGFSLRRASYSRLGEDFWLRLNYTDGVETLLYASTLPGDSSSDSSDAPGIDPPNVADGQPESVRTYSIGRIAALQGVLRHRQVMALGKTDAELLVDLVQSSLP